MLFGRKNIVLNNNLKEVVFPDALKMEINNTVVQLIHHSDNELQPIEPSIANSTLRSLEDFTMDSNFARLLCSLVLVIVWVTYITYYHSRVLGYILTRIINRNLFLKHGSFHIGSFTWSVLSGKVMFRDVVYMTHDYTIRIQDGWIIFRWWRAYVPKNASDDLSHSDTRVSIMLNGYELHMYNRTSLYANLEKTFNIEPQGFSREDPDNKDDNDKGALTTSKKAKKRNIHSSKWRDLIPVIKVDVLSGRVVFGNRLIPTTLSVNIEEAHFVYSTKPAASRLDPYMHFVKCLAENFKVILAPSPKYTGMVDEPPRYMGEGFVVLSSNKVDLYFYMDEPGVVPAEPAMCQLANGDIVESASPVWGVDIKCGKGTHFSYGPWANRQREHLFRFFFPNDYRPMEVSKPPLPGERRQVQSFDIRLSTQDHATIDILFTKNKETNAVHVNIEPGSYLEVTLPWLVQTDGYTTRVRGQLLHVDASTSLLYRALLESETLEFNVRCHFPLRWNDHQDWNISLTGCKTTAHLIYSHKGFFQDLINDWSSKSQPDLLTFVPYSWKFSLILKEFEIITQCNKYNWIDCSSTNQENTHIAFNGELFDLSFELPFTEFLPATLPVRIWIQGESVDVLLYVPDTCTSYSILQGLDRTAKILDRDGHVKTTQRNDQKKWRRVCLRNSGWIDCWSVPIVALSINYKYHPQPPWGPPPQADITTPEKEELLLSPMRMPRGRKTQGIHWTQPKPGTEKFHPTSLPADEVSVDLEIGSSVMFLYGTLLKNFMNLKENIFGDDQDFTDMGQEKENGVSKEGVVNIDDDKKCVTFDARQYRPLDVIVTVTMHDIQAHVMKNCNEKDPSCPLILIERLGVEMKKGYRETKLQVLLSPSMLLTSDTVVRPTRDAHIGQGHLMLSGLQIRGHAMFSDEGRSLDDETLEYAWMIEIQMGKLSGKLTTPQLYNLVTGLETLVLLAVDDENELISPGRPITCVHGIPQSTCANGQKLVKCPAAEDMKYRMTRLAADALDVYFIESGTAIHLWASPLRLSTCNLHGHRVKSGVTGLLPLVEIRQYISAGNCHLNHSNSASNTSNSAKSHHMHSSYRNLYDETWLEVGSMTFGPLVIESALSLPYLEQDLVQHKFLKLHDENTRRLWFLWSDSDTEPNEEKIPERCGCIGGCTFFGSNRNGQKFFKPSRQDIQDGINIAAFRINDSIEEPGFGQSILHKDQLVFHTPPYDSCQFSVQESYYYWDNTSRAKSRTSFKLPMRDRRSAGSPSLRRVDSQSLEEHSCGSPGSYTERKSMRRRFSCTSANNSRAATLGREVAYSRLDDGEKRSLKFNSFGASQSKPILAVPELELHRRSSASDSKLLVDTDVNLKQPVAPLNWVGPAPECRHSLTLPQEQKASYSEMPRTTSITSENQSELYFSADENLSSAMAELSSEDTIVGVLMRQDSYDSRPARCKFLSESCIMDRSSAAPESITESNCSAPDRVLLSSHCSDHEIHTPQHRSSYNRTLDHRCFAELSEDQANETLMMDSSETDSISSTSFISAVSSQEENGLVNLHMQINRPILEAPLLMSSYIHHLSQAGCWNWNSCTVPPGCDAYSIPGSLFKKSKDGFLSYGGAIYTPYFSNITEGFTYLRMISRINEQITPPPSCKTPTHPYQWDSNMMSEVKKEGKFDEKDGFKFDEEFLDRGCDAGQRTTILIRFQGDVDVMITPLALESLQRFIDSLTTTVSTLHPLTVLNNLYSDCIAKVKDANVLKKEEYLNNFPTSSPKMDAKQGKEKIGVAKLMQSNVYQQSISAQTQGVIMFPKVNVTLLQASVVEELTPFSALDNIRDFACVSVFAVCIDKVTAKFHLEKQTREIVQAYQRPAVTPSQKKTGLLGRSARPLLTGSPKPTARDQSGLDPVYIESSEKRQTEIIVMLNLGKIHAQLRRLPNESSILKDAVVTAIPAQHSKVMFTCTKIHTLPRTDRTDRNEPIHEAKDESSDKLGFIMFETGLEGVSIKVVKHERFDKSLPPEVPPIDTATFENTKEKFPQEQNSEKVKEKPTAGPVSVLSQTEQILTAIRFSSKTAASLNSFMEARNLKSKLESKIVNKLPEASTSKAPEDTKTSNTGDDKTGGTPGATLGNVAEAAEALEGVNEESNTSSVVIELNSMWFNFAAPPRTPITRKIDYTRLDWNLLSTASPAINAWMNPSSRFASRLMLLLRSAYRRSCGVVACLMAEALDVHKIHSPCKSRYGRLTPLAKTLQEDPSCQLCNVLHKYVLFDETNKIEEYLSESYLPALTILRQGVIVLSRQWKSVLYTPLLLDHNYKLRHFKPMNVTVAMPEPEDDTQESEGNNSAEYNEVTDECAVLIDSDNGSPILTCKVDKNLEGEKPSIRRDVESSFTSPTSTSLPSGKGKKKHLPPLNPPSSSRASIAFPILTNGHPFTVDSNKFSANEGYAVLQEDRLFGSNHSTISNGPGSRHSLNYIDKDNLYIWMAKQKEFVNETTSDLPQPWQLASPAVAMEMSDPVTSPAPGYNVYSPASPVGDVNFYNIQDSLCMLDAHQIFQPLLLSLGVIPQQMISNIGSSSNSAVFDTWGSSLSLVGSMETLRIDIVVSEFGKPLDKKRSKGKGKSPDGKFFLDLPPDVPSFLCERIGIEIDVKKSADMTVDDMIQKQNVLYVSRGQLKKHTSTRINFSLNIHYISQQVNMPLLRLLHQISNMYENVKETQMELREQELNKSAAGTSKHANGSSSTSDLQEHLSITDHHSKSTNNHKTALSPSSSLLARPQLLAQKLRSTTKSVKGYMNLNDSLTTPITENSSLDKALKPKCWKTVTYLLDLYATMPETKTISHRFSVAPDATDGGGKMRRKPDIDNRTLDDVEKGQPTSSTPLPFEKPRELNIIAGERTRIMVFGVARIHRTRFLATLSGLKLEAEMSHLHSSMTCKKKQRPESLECSLTGQVGRTMIVLLEGVAPNQQTVVKVTVGKSQTLYSSLSGKAKDKNSGLLTIGAIEIDIPQHPVALHGMMTRGSKQLSSTLQELGVTRASRAPKNMTIDENDGVGSFTSHQPMPSSSAKSTTTKHVAESYLLQPLVMQFSVILQSLSITAALLPSLQAQYKMDQVNSTGVTGSKAKFTVDLPRHSLSFTTKLQVTEANLPSEASIELPKVHVSAEYIQDGKSTVEAKLADGVVLREGSYLNATADIGRFEHSLTTDLLNHLVFVQKVFMNEVNEVLQKVYGGEKVVPIWQEDDEPSSSQLKRILFSLIIRIQRIQLTATTPTNSAVRLETGAVEFELSNRVENVSGAVLPDSYMKIFGKMSVDINLSLGQILKNVLFEEAEPEFQQFAFFKTRIGLRNAFQGEMVQGEDKEVVLITLKRPLIYIQPMAVDKAILVWLNYKTAYEYWNEQRSNLNKEVLTATQQVFEKVPFGTLGNAQHLGTLFLQLTVDDMGICLPLNPLPPSALGFNRSIYPESESRGAVVVTLESTIISACSSGSLVSKGRFVGLCLRFAEDFEASLDDWKPNANDTAIMNLCVVSEGTYEVCSRTIAQRQGKENAKWFLNVQWQMEGVDIHLDVNVGKQLSALGHTLTMLTGSTEEEDSVTLDYDSDDAQENLSIPDDSLPAFIFDPSIDSKRRSKLIEKEMHETAKNIQTLRCLGASHGTIEHEVKRLKDIENVVYKDFRRDMIQKIRRQSVKASSIKGKFGLGKNASFRSKSFIAPSPTPEHGTEIESPDEIGQENIKSGGLASSIESSPVSGPSRSASIRTREGPKVTFSETHNICRQSSLPSADSDLSMPSELDWADHVMIDGELVLLRKKYPTHSSEDVYPFREENYENQDSAIFSTHSSTVYKPQEPNIDFELDVKVLINSGKCVLHTKDSLKDEEIRIAGKIKKERSCSGGMFEFPPSSPNSGRRNKDGKQSNSNIRGRYLHGNMAQLVDLTIFHIPGLDVKVHYESRMENDETLTPDIGYSSMQQRRSGNKKASLYAWTTLQSIPEETIISPHILEFLEQTLEPIPQVPSKDNFASGGHNMFAMDSDGGWGVGTTTSNYVYASFPVDVMVYFHMEPSTFRFSCLPASRVECMLQLPSLDIVFSSKRAEEELCSEFGEQFSNMFSEMGHPSSAVGGLSVTGCLSNFSVHIFHPYGGGKKSSGKEPQWSPLADSERKDSLSINVEFVKFHLSRSRKINFQSEQGLGIKSPGVDQSRAAIRFSTIVDIGSASFKYDMRRLTEILAFPKAWYRRSIVRRLFLGELNVGGMYADDGRISPFAATDEAGQKNESARHMVDGLGPSRSSGISRSPLMSAQRDKLKLNLGESRARFKEGGRMQTLQEDSPSAGSSDKNGPAWETLVLFAVNFTKLNVQMSMGNVMGNAIWLTKDFHSEGRLSIGSTGHKNMYIGIGLGRCSLDAKGGIVGGTIELDQIDTFVHIREDPGTEPDHTVGLKLNALELRLDYMGSGVLMTRVSSLNVSLRDEWKIHNFKNTDSYNPTRRPAMIFMHGTLVWDQLQIMISKSTTADLLKMFLKLDEFFSQQFQSSKRVFSSFQPRFHQRGSFKKKTLRKKSSSENGAPAPASSQPSLPSQDVKHHRHWQDVLAAVGGLSLYTFKIPLPLNGTVLGGTMDLRGYNISLACFHGINFKSKSWALFSLKEPCISFVTEAQEIPGGEEGTMDVHVVETLTFSLGMTSDMGQARHNSMATICRISRNVLFPPQYKSLQDWFHYAFSSSEIDAVDRFPSLETEERRNRAGANAGSGPSSVGSSKLADHNHTREVIFALPTLQLHLKTEHLQATSSPDGNGEKPIVECSFITEFEDHIFVTIDAEGFFFLHDLITSYLKEKEKVNTNQNITRAQSPDSEKKKDLAYIEDEKKKKAFDPGEMFTKDWRTYHCKTWHLEPTVRLWSWAGKSIEPYGIDFILQKLGFAQARTTIPKWMQRGFMDPLDKVLAVLMMHMVAMVKDSSDPPKRN